MHSDSPPPMLDSATRTPATKRRRGFAIMSPEKKRLIASLGGRTAHAAGSAHQFSSDEARAAGRLGGQAVSKNREHMAEIGRRGGQQRGINLRSDGTAAGDHEIPLPPALPGPSPKLVLALLLLLLAGVVSAATAQTSQAGSMASMRAPDDPLFWPVPVTLSPQCHFLGDCAQFDAISLKVGTVSVARGDNGNQQFAAMSGLVHASISLLDIAELGAAVGGYVTHDETGAFHVASMPIALHAKLRIFPLLWKKLSQSGDAQVAVSFQHSLTQNLGAQEPPGFDINTVRVMASRSVGPVDLDLGIGGIWGNGQMGLRRAVELQGTVALRLFGLAKPLTPDEQFRLMAQALYRFSLPGDSLLADGFVILGGESQNHSGYRFGVGAGPYLLGSRVGGFGMVTFSAAWGPRYRNPLAEYIASKPPWIPKVWMDLLYIDPVLEKDGCVWTDPARFRMKIKCVGNPDPNDPNTIVLYDGRRLPVNTHLWIRDDGALVTQRQEEVARLDADTAWRAILVQKVVSWWKSQKSEPCRLPPSILEQAQRSNIFAFAAVLPDAEGLRAGEFLQALVDCGLPGAMATGGLPPITKFRGGGSPAHMPPTFSRNGSQQTEAEHVQPAVPATYKSQFLADNEAQGGHVLERHVGKTDQELVERLWTDRKVDTVSTFANEGIAESVIKETLAKNQQKIAAWLEKPSDATLPLNYVGDKVLGRGISEGEFNVSDKMNARVVLKQDKKGGYYVLTAFTE